MNLLKWRKTKSITTSCMGKSARVLTYENSLCLCLSHTHTIRLWNFGQNPMGMGGSNLRCPSPSYWWRGLPFRRVTVSLCCLTLLYRGCRMLRFGLSRHTPRVVSTVKKTMELLVVSTQTSLINIQIKSWAATIQCFRSLWSQQIHEESDGTDSS